MSTPQIGRLTTSPQQAASRPVLRQLLMTTTLALGVSSTGAMAQTIGNPDAARHLEPLPDWQFTTDDVDPADDTATATGDGWTQVNLPHTWNAQDGSEGGDNYYRGDGFYQTTFEVTDDLGDRRVFVQVGAANEIAEVFVNGTSVGTHAGGYSAFRFDVTDDLVPGENRIVIQVNNAPHRLAPIDADFTFFGGLYRDVALVEVAPVHVDLTDSGGPGVYLTTQDISPEEATVEARIKLANDGADDATVTLRTQARDDTGTVVAESETSVTLAAAQKQEQVLDLKIDQPRLWQGRADPYLYSVVTTVTDAEGNVLDEVTEPLGIREIRIDPQEGFLLNGESVPLRGVSYHQDVEDGGFAATEEQKRRDFDIMDELGANAVRLAHYQHSRSVYDLADEFGMVTWAEVPVISEVDLTDAYAENARQQMQELVRQNYNHPSIAVWGIWNEVSLQSDSDVSSLLTELNALAKSEDPSRPTTAAVLGRLGPDEAVMNVTDTVGQNLYFGWYYGNPTGDLGAWLDELHAAAPDLPIGVSEYGAGAGPSIQSETPFQQDHTETYQANYHEEAYLQMKERPWLWSTFVWAMFDFASDGRDEGEAPGINDKGLVTRDRETRKDAFYWYQANWSEDPVLHLTGKRLIERQRGNTTVKVYSNLPQAELFLNGESMGVVETPDSRRLTWDLELASGTNSVEVVAEVDGDTMTDTAEWELVTNDDTLLTSGVIAVDGIQDRVLNLPYDTVVDDMQTLFDLPFGAHFDFGDRAGDAPLSVDDTFDVVAQNGDRRTYTIDEGALSVARRVQANREGVGRGLPDGPATFAVDGKADFVTDMSEGGYWHTRDVLPIPAWIKVDLGSEYYVDTVETSWFDPSSSVEGTGLLTYKIDTAPQEERSFAVFNETYEPVIDTRDTTETGKTEDDIDRVARYVRVTIQSSDYYMMRGGEPFQNKGLTELSVLGGLIHSDEVEIDYRAKTIQAGSRSVEEVAAQLETVSDDDQVTVEDGAIVVTAADGLRRERYDVISN
ncbi:glycoside hydrolase family 2 TIM barrel-domain containing protein [Halomonas sp. PAMB 3232]|uniref:glycoside hydrolase family 2 protein n=1 Tax=Halomonas sp. PAMB 3232 TaxID=3075221 RepID=UPI0028984A9D|nr:glycoside hydrolase family 2 TIM barrel-domain containing protein [Halomonas sp. PAMB 3232]WNL38101.1 glycoside hydrolase family 2 TIM barrel-domain containing protein [Halomonas sp. PAMB 3232]